MSPQVQQALCADLGFDAARTLVLANGIDTAAYASSASAGAATALRGELGLDAAARVIVAVGRLVHNKGQMDLLEAMPLVLARFPSAVLVLVGDGPDGDALAQHVARHGLGKAVRLTGARTDIAAHLALAEIFALVSSSEGVSLALLEAMAAGRPIVATAVAGIVDVIEHGRSGLLVPFADHRALADALGVLLEDQALARQLGANAEREARSRYDIDGTVRAMAALYRAAMARHDC